MIKILTVIMVKKHHYMMNLVSILLMYGFVALL